MTAVLAWPVVLSALAGLGTLGLIGRLWGLRGKPGAAWLLVALGGQAVAAFAYTLALLVVDPTLRWALAEGFLLAMFLVAATFPGFVLAYTGRGDLLGSWWGRGYLGLTAVFGGLFLTNPWHHLVWRSFEVREVLGLAGVAYTFTPLAQLTIVAGGGAILVSSLLLFETVLSYGPLYRGEAIAVGSSTVPPLVGILLWVFQVGPLPELNLTAALFVPHVLLDGYAFVRSDMFEFHPATRRTGERAAIEDLGSPVVIVDEQGRIVTCNDAAEADLGIDLAAARTEPLNDHLDGANVSPATGDQRVGLRTPAGRRQYTVVPDRLADARGTQLGYTLVFQDVTAERRREQRLAVLNRILRHNLRNDLNVVEGFLQAARDRSDDDEVAAMLNRARSKSRDLIHVGENARAIEAALEDGGSTAETSVRDLAHEVRADLDGPGDRDRVTVDVPEGVTLETNRQLLQTMLRNLVENGLVHNDSESPSVTVTAAAENDRTTIVVADNGPGIPDHELEVLGAGEETALEHGSGLGLWLVDWGARHLGGHADFETGTAGTTVTLIVDG
jgi:signal transduction histidine kinase